jgi:hypothetical protein
MSGHALWFYASIGFLVIISIAFAAAFGQQEFRENSILNYKKWPLLALVFWIGLEAPTQLALFLIIFNVTNGASTPFHRVGLLRAAEKHFLPNQHLLD